MVDHVHIQFIGLIFLVVGAVLVECSLHEGATIRAQVAHSVGRVDENCAPVFRSLAHTAPQGQVAHLEVRRLRVRGARRDDEQKRRPREGDGLLTQANV